MDSREQASSRDMEIFEGIMMGDELAAERQGMQEEFLGDIAGTLSKFAQEIAEIKQYITQMQGGNNQEAPVMAPINPRVEQGKNEGLIENIAKQVGINNATSQ